MSYNEEFARLPAAPAGALKGFLPPLHRAAQHLIVCAAGITAEPALMTIDESLVEITHAKEHWDAITTPEALSTGAAAYIGTFGRVLGEAVTEWATWTDVIRRQNTLNLANRVAALTATLDRELVGLMDSAPGPTL